MMISGFGGGGFGGLVRGVGGFSSAGGFKGFTGHVGGGAATQGAHPQVATNARGLTLATDKSWLA